jgi:hypothetical protein
MILHGEPDKLKGLRPVRRGDAELSRKLEVRFLPYHLWLVDSPSYRFPFGFAAGRYVSDLSLDGSVQEPWQPDERPDDCLSEQALRELLRRAWNNPW